MKVFISYAHSDREIASNMIEYLERAGFEVWPDHRLKSGEIFEHAITDAMIDCDWFIVLMTKNYNNSEHAQHELNFGLSSAESNLMNVVFIIAGDVDLAPVQRYSHCHLIRMDQMNNWRDELSSYILNHNKINHMLDLANKAFSNGQYERADLYYSSARDTLLDVQIHHSEAFNNASAIAVSLDGKKIVVAHGSELNVYFFDGLNTPYSHATMNENVTAMAFTPNGKRIVVGTESGRIMDFDIRFHISNVNERSMRSLGPIRMIATRYDNEIFALGTDAGIVYLWDGKYLFDRIPSLHVKAIAFNQHGDLLAYDGETIVTHVLRRQNEKDLEHEEISFSTPHITMCSFDPYGKLLAYVEENDRIGLFDIETKRCIHERRIANGVKRILMNGTRMYLLTNSEFTSFRPAFAQDKTRASLYLLHGMLLFDMFMTWHHEKDREKAKNMLEDALELLETSDEKAKIWFLLGEMNSYDQLETARSWYKKCLDSGIEPYASEAAEKITLLMQGIKNVVPEYSGKEHYSDILDKAIILCQAMIGILPEHPVIESLDDIEIFIHRLEAFAQTTHTDRRNMLSDLEATVRQLRKKQLLYHEGLSEEENMRIQAMSSLLGTNNGKPKKYDVFISYKSEDSHLAKRVHQYLLRQGKRTFMAEVSLLEHGISDYAEVIDDALDASTHLVIVTSNISFLKTPWVRYEWRSFELEKREGRKQGQVVIVMHSSIMPTKNNVPYPLRRMTIISTQEYRQKIMNYLR